MTRRPGSSRNRWIAAIALAVLAQASVAEARGKHRRAKAAEAPEAMSGPTVTFAGFEPLDNGSSRVVVKLTSDVPVAVRGSGRHIEYVLQGAHIGAKNNANPLVTGFFPSTLLRAELVSPETEKKKKKGKKAEPPPDAQSQDLRLVVELREAVSPNYHFDKHTDGSATFVVDFPKPSGPPAPVADNEPPNSAQVSP